MRATNTVRQDALNRETGIEFGRERSILKDTLWKTNERTPILSSSMANTAYMNSPDAAG
ncbi:hypothetical protein GCM10028809_69420 [Spirosoma gilvum]